MQNSRIKNIIILSIKLVAIAACLVFIAEHYFFEIEPSAVSVVFILSFVVLIALNWHTQTYKKTNYFKPIHIPLIVVLLFLAVHFRTGIVWALNTFPLRNAHTVLLTLEEPFDAFAYGMFKQYLSTTIPQAIIITAILTVFLYTILGSTKKRLTAIGAYFVATTVLFISDIPISDYIHILNDEPEKNAFYSKFFVENYVNPDTVKITPPEHKRNLILIYIESLETTFSDKEHGGNQDTNLIPEITELALQNLSFGKNGKHIGGGLDSHGSAATFSAMISRSLGIPDVFNYKKMPIIHHYKSIYKILNDNGYKQIFFQGNPGLYKQFQYLALDQKINEVYGPDDLAQRLNLDYDNFVKKQGFKNVQDKDAFRFAGQILDTISEPFSLTFFTIDTHSPHGLYDPDCIKASDESNKDELLKASARCVSRELNKFLVSLKNKSFYENTTIIVFGDHLFMGTRLVKDFPDRKWINFFINPAKIPISEEKRRFSDIDMFPTILSSINFDIVGNRLGFGTDLFSDKKTLVEEIGLDTINKEFFKMTSHLIYESYLLKKRQSN
ncbi:MAG: sulfatase-like hydrolase/transferase [Fibrobacter sp.]|nr:sulfatase-like hydrolase/transferase [Fibrobacter sp.]